jgi:hypothetical protein
MMLLQNGWICLPLSETPNNDWKPCSMHVYERTKQSMNAHSTYYGSNQRPRHLALFCRYVEWRVMEDVPTGRSLRETVSALMSGLTK